MHLWKKETDRGRIFYTLIILFFNTTLAPVQKKKKKNASLASSLGRGFPLNHYHKTADKYMRTAIY